MKSLMSINYKFMELSPKELIGLVLESKFCKGVEIYIEKDNPFETKYLDDLIYEIQRNDLVLQIHGDSRIPLEEQIDFLKRIENYSSILGYPITITLHSVYNEDKEISKELTINYFTELLSKIDNNKLIICLENLNDDGPLDRLEKEYIRPIILNDNRLYMTYDIGHEIADYGDITNIDGYLMDEIRNIHIHTHDDQGHDHQPIYKNSLFWDSVLKGILFLVINGYTYNVVFEYDVYACHGNTLKEKIEDYLKSIDFVSERFGE